MSDIKSIQLQYMNRIADAIEDIVPPSKRHRYCLIFGNRVMEDFATLAEARQTMRTIKLAWVLYTPPPTPLESTIANGLPH